MRHDGDEEKEEERNYRLVVVAGKIAVVMKRASLGEVRSLDVTLALAGAVGGAELRSER